MCSYWRQSWRKPHIHAGDLTPAGVVYVKLVIVALEIGHIVNSKGLWHNSHIHSVFPNWFAFWAVDSSFSDTPKNVAVDQTYTIFGVDDRQSTNSNGKNKAPVYWILLSFGESYAPHSSTCTCIDNLIRINAIQIYTTSYLIPLHTTDKHSTVYKFVCK